MLKLKIPLLLSGAKNVPVLLFLDLHASLSEKLVLHRTPTEILERIFSTDRVKKESPSPSLLGSLAYFGCFCNRRGRRLTEEA